MMFVGQKTVVFLFPPRFFQNESKKTRVRNHSIAIL
jgi:hypothetical protein